MELQEAHLRYQDGLIIRLAQAMVRDKAWDRARACILADALLEAGHDSEEWQHHLRYSLDHDGEYQPKMGGRIQYCGVLHPILLLAEQLGILPTPDANKE